MLFELALTCSADDVDPEDIVELITADNLSVAPRCPAFSTQECEEFRGRRHWRCAGCCLTDLLGRSS